jgi:hypothetical protein
LSEDLKAGEDFMNNREALQDLMSKGFTPAATSEGAADEIISSDGEVIATMKDGTEYVLRFGNLTNVGSGGQDNEPVAAAEAAAAAKPKDGDVNRYLFVMARFDESAVKQPELQQLPELPAKEEAKAAEGDPEESAAESDETADQSQQPTDSPSPENETATEEDKAAEETEVKDAAAEDKEADAEKDKELEKVIAERKRIEQENQRKLDEYQQTLKKGRETVKDLNLRFGDWYFVVDDDVFQKVRLSRDDVVKKKEKPKAEGEATEGASEPAVPGTAVPGLPQIPGVSE